MQAKLTTHLAKNFLFLKGKKLLIACSGGVDSVVLAHLMHRVGYVTGIAHCNFSLRGKESDGDEAFVLDLAEQLSVPVFTETFDTIRYAKDQHLSTQMAARELRYRWFEELLKDFKYDYVLTAHHADDDLETFLINLSRGTGLRGLTGIPAINDRIIRPFLPFSSKQILNFAKKEHLYWREDSSNAATKYLRNALRHEVIPNYKKVTKNTLQQVQKTQQYLKNSQSLIDDYMVLIYNLAVTENFDGYTIHLQKLEELPNKETVLYELLQSFGFTDHKAVIDLLTAQSGKQVFSKTHRLLKDRGVFILTKIKASEDIESKFNESDNRSEHYFIQNSEKKITQPIALTIIPTDKVGYLDTNTIYIDQDKIDFPLVLRKWEEGDVFQPFGMKGKKKLSKFFKDEKLSLVAKENVWLLCSNNQIIWVVGYRADERFKVSTTTQRILEIKLLDT
ncbi:tRNA lysidine(34) synthetase TilS [Cochleicola gelatinilyticus]|uniref:tRNA(Ile)-lysidine synthase n=1 Tax=Cochleicola gelatinilyticus TaxID=1763537 RepID=A0A167HK35_9FLAO|nr:tRNA lysidine(34) synthetase TilS [Cochleicola gelatinilyticus]OAB78696.1 tRNA(Ile)-lysidine synthetase [Cochleicola gelatinilyticus]